MNDHVPPANLQQLTVAEKLRLMEDIWASLCEAPERLDVPAWHREELDRRLDSRAGNAASSWADAKQDILKGLRKS